MTKPKHPYLQGKLLTIKFLTKCTSSLCNLTISFIKVLQVIEELQNMYFDRQQGEIYLPQQTLFLRSINMKNIPQFPQHSNKRGQQNVLPTGKNSFDLTCGHSQSYLKQVCYILMQLLMCITN